MSLLDGGGGGQGEHGGSSYSPYGGYQYSRTVAPGMFYA